MSKVVSVVGGGWSFLEVDQKKVPGYVIAVNDSGLRLERPVDCILTMDRLWTEGRWAQLLNRQSRFRVRRNALQNIRGHSDLPWVQKFECNERSTVFSDDAAWLNGTSSGMCALNEAYQQVPTELYMFGFDMCRSPAGNPYWYPAYPWAPAGGTTTGKYQAWAKQFDIIARAFESIGTKVYNVSSVSKIESFRRFTPKQLMMRK